MSSYVFRTDHTAADERLAYLHRKPAGTPEHLARLVKIKRTGGGFLVKGQRVELGETVRVPAWLAADLIAIGKAERVE